jgi:hypothetical protein
MRILTYTRVHIQAIAKDLAGLDTLNARLVCKRWHFIVSPLVHVAILSPRHVSEAPEAHRWGFVL